MEAGLMIRGSNHGGWRTDEQTNGESSTTVDCAPMSRRTESPPAPDARAFTVPRRLAARRVVAAAVRKLTVSMPPGQPVHVRYLDTFDRRLRRAGRVLEHVALPGEAVLRYREIGRAGVVEEAPAARPPAFARDLPHFRLRSLLSPLVDIRRLLVVAESKGRRTVARGRDAEDKTVLVVECLTGRRGPNRLIVHPLRGYERFARRAVRRLRKVEGAEPDESEPMLAASDGPDAALGGLPVPARVGTGPDARSDVACRRLLRQLDAALEMNAPGIEADLDPECLHDFRVAVRRTRSLLREMKGVFPASVTRRLGADLGWLGRRTGPVRDLDVHLMELGVPAPDGEAGRDDAAAAPRDRLRAASRRSRADSRRSDAAAALRGLPVTRQAGRGGTGSRRGDAAAALRGLPVTRQAGRGGTGSRRSDAAAALRGLPVTRQAGRGGTGSRRGDAAAALRDHLQALRKRELRALCRALRSARYRRLRAALGKFLESGAPVRPRSANALVPVGVLSAARILKVHRRVLAEGRAIGSGSPAEALHDLRKTCKRLRYLLEFFRDVHPAKPVERAIARLKRLQDNLGTYQDVQVQRAVLEAFREQARASLDAAAADAVDARCAALAERERATRAEFAARFASYDSKHAHKAFGAALRRGRQ